MASSGTGYEVEVTISSTKDLKNVNWRHGSLKPYAVIWVDPNNKCSTRVDEEGDTSPFWDQTLRIPLPPDQPDIEDHKLHIDIVHAGAEADTKPLIGSASLKLSDVLDDEQPAKRTLHLKRPSGRPQGNLDVKVSIRDTRHRHREPEPYYAPSNYGVPQPQPPASYPYNQAYGTPYTDPYYSSAPPPSGYPYSAPPPYSTAYQPSYGAYHGYGEQASVYEEGEKKKNKLGGMGTGLAVGAVAGALGGIALVEGVNALEDKIADDVAEKVEDDLDGDYDSDGGDDDF